jgi:hypothetical protein
MEKITNNNEIHLLWYTFSVESILIISIFIVWVIIIIIGLIVDSINPYTERSIEIPIYNTKQSNIKDEDFIDNKINNTIQDSQPTINTKWEQEKNIQNINTTYIDPKAVVGTHYTMSLANQSSTENTFEVDVMITIDGKWLASKGSTLSAIAFGINYNPDILNWGKPCTSLDCGSWMYIWWTSKELEKLPLQRTRNRESPVWHLRVISVPSWNGVDIKPWTYTIGRYRFTNTVSWKKGSNAELWLQPNNSNPMGSTNTIILSYPFQTRTPIYAYTTTAPSNAPWVTLTYTESSPYSVPLNTK